MKREQLEAMRDKLVDDFYKYGMVRFKGEIFAVLVRAHDSGVEAAKQNERTHRCGDNPPMSPRECGCVGDIEALKLGIDR